MARKKSTGTKSPKKAAKPAKKVIRRTEGREVIVGDEAEEEFEEELEEEALEEEVLEDVVVGAGDFVEFEIPMELIRLGEHQPRDRDSIHARGSLTKLKDSIRELGMLQPILVQAQEDGSFLLISGERRFQSCRELGHKKIRAVLPSSRTLHALEQRGKTLDELALFENLQRKNLTAIEEGRCYSKLIELLDLTQEELADRLGLKQPYINERIGFLRLPDDVQVMIEEGEISTSQARELSRLNKLPKADRAAKQVELAKQLVVEKLTVRKAKKLVDKALGETPTRDGAHLTRLGAKKAAYFISTLNHQFGEIDLHELEEDIDKLDELRENVPALIKKLQQLEGELQGHT